MRELQKWYVPNLSENDVLDKPMSEIMVSLLQMKMEMKASKARRKHEEKKAEQKRKSKQKK